MGSDAGLARTAIATAALLAPIAHADPFPTRDQNPFLAGFGLPGPMPTRIDPSEGWSFDFALNWASTALVQSNAREALLVDAETQEWRVSIQRPLGDRFALRLEAPYRTISAGSLDGFIDDWHDAFGLPEGARPVLPQDQLSIVYERDGVRVFELESPQSGLGDAAVSVGYSLLSRELSFLTAWATLELPTGDSQRLSGNDAVDVSLAVAAEHRIADQLTLYGQAGLTWREEGGLLSEQQHAVTWSGMTGLAWRVSAPIELKLQLDAHSGVFEDSDLDFLNEAVILTVGGAVHFRSGWRVDLGVSEDIAVETSPDVVFVIGVSRRSRN